MTRILIADDHAIVRKGIRQLIVESRPFTEIGEAADAEELVKKALFENWDLIICDLNMPGRSGLEALKQIKQSTPALPVLIMSMYPEDQFAVRILKAGASGFLSKDSIHEELLKAIDKALAGKKFISPKVAEKLAEALDPHNETLLHDSLSDREFEVLKLLASGKTISDIAEQLSLSSTTISTYRSRILEKMQLRSNSEMVRYAIENKLI